MTTSASAPLLGRADDVAAVTACVTAAADGAGGALLLLGPAGIGKTAVLEQAVSAAAAREVAVLRTTGTKPEATLAFAGLHHLLLPLLSSGRDDRIAATLRTAFGADGEHLPDLYRVALATLELLAEAAERAPLLLVVDDAHWLDPPTADVVGFVARRLAAEPIAMVLAARDDEPSPMRATGLPARTLAPLSAQESRTLLAASAGHLEPDTRDRLLHDAAGNPLALVELPRALGSGGGPAWPLPVALPLNARLERAFAARVDELPVVTRSLLLLAAADPACDVVHLLRAARVLTGTPGTPAAFAPAVEAGLVHVAGTAVRFRHPLVASGVYHGAPYVDRLAAHSALASVVDDDEDRRTWHRAAATLGADDDVAAALVACAERARARGAVMVSVAALERAAELTTEPGRQTDLALRAAEQASELGRRETAAAMLARADAAALPPVVQARRLTVREMVDPGDIADVGRIAELHRAATAIASEDPALAAHLLWRAASRAWWSGAPDVHRAPIVAATASLGLPREDVARLAILAYAAPVQHGTEVVEALARLEPDPADAEALRFAGSAALIAGDFAGASRWWAQSEALNREQGRLALLVRTVSSSAYARCWTGEWDAVLTGAREASALAADTGEIFWVAAGFGAQAQFHGLRGESAEAERAARTAQESPLARGVRFVLFAAQQGLAYAAVADGRHDEAYQLIRLCFDERSPVFHRDMRFWVLGDLAELAVRAGAAQEARAIVASLAPLARMTASPRTRLALAYAEALLAPPELTEARYRAALALDLRTWPLDRARILLSYGTWLRRMRRASESRAPLREAQAAFAALGPTAWSARAHEELAASGETRRTLAPAARDELTPQELQIAQMAARGLTNREIAQHLYLSHRTVGSHLYRVFPKLGIASRGELADALATESRPNDGGGGSDD